MFQESFRLSTFDFSNTLSLYQWTQQYLSDLDKVNAFYLSQVSEVAERLEQLESDLATQTVLFLALRQQTQPTTHNTSIEAVKVEQLNEPARSTDWRKAFAEVLATLRRLYHFCIHNKKVCQKYFLYGLTFRLFRAFQEAIQANDEDIKTLKKYTREREVFNTKRISELRTHLLELYASYFTNNDQKSALKALQGAKKPIRSSAKTTCLVFVGILLTLVLAVGSLLLIPGDMGYYKSDQIYVIFPLFRWSLVLDLAIFGIAACLKIYSQYKIDYGGMLELSPHYPTYFSGFQKLAVCFFYLWLLCLYLQIVAFKHSLMPTHTSLFALILFLAHIVFIVLPFDMFNRTARYGFLYTLGRILIAPFAEVRFKDLILGDVLCSAVKPLQDISFCACYFFTDAWVRNTEPSCSGLPLSVAILGMLPYYWRLMQCLRKYRDTGDKFPHLVNAGKYLSCLAVPLLGLIKLLTDTSYNDMAVAAQTIATVYAYIWDITMDWSLAKRDTVYPLLRRKLKFAPKYYYMAMITNLFLRFAWTLTLFKDAPYQKSKLGLHTLVFVLSFCEMVRRVQWCVFRLENEGFVTSVNSSDLLEKQII
eukprot:TRINITY_DN918_c0_g1_i1.p1 TRINITY_DN918_c0_g1~~TRINITY_DN918_c0_g1_i1.p1  ORF type:complete len:591 (+),score=3.98 TRINITY_DN918_c0_g1_i1:363-2135(+)